MAQSISQKMIELWHKFVAKNMDLIVKQRWVFSLHVFQNELTNLLGIDSLYEF